MHTVDDVVVTPEDLEQAAASCVATLAPHTGADWSAGVPDLEWTRLQTAAHVCGALVYYAGQLGTRSPERRPSIWTRDEAASPDDVVSAVQTTAAILAAVARATPPGTRAYHRMGQADASGFLAMGCAEILVHTWDLAGALGLAYTGPPDVTDRTVRRLFPWAPGHPDPWARLLWSCGRAPLDDLPRQDEDWVWHCAPLEEWDGVARIAPPDLRQR